MSHPNFRIGIILLLSKKRSKNIFRPLFDATMVDMNGLRRNHCVSTDGKQIFT
jgi:hypothetical protein